MEQATPVARRPLHERTTRLKRGSAAPSSELLEFERRLALFTAVFGSADAGELLAGLADPGRHRVRETVRQLAALASPSRQARVAGAFGPRDDAPRRLRELLVGAGPGLLEQLRGHLPVYLRSALPPPGEPLHPSPALPCPAARAVAARLALEATR